MCQHFLMKRPLKPLGPGDFSMGIFLTALSMSSFVKGAPICWR
jgi:hypothetical protein